MARELDARHVVVNAVDFDALETAVQSAGPLTGIINCAGSLLRPLA